MYLEHRLFYNESIIREDAQWKHLLKFLIKYQPCIDAVSLSDDIYHYAYHDDAHNEEVAQLLSRRLNELKRNGFEHCGIINLGTIGHIDEAVHRKHPLSPMVGYDGRVSASCICPNAPINRAHINKEYKLYAAAHPEILWVDDDVKIHTNGIRFGCFCNDCLNIFSENYGYSYVQRQQLVDDLEKPENAKLRSDWVSHISDTVNSLLSDIEQAIHEVDPSIQTGFMSMRQSWSTYNGEDFDRWFATLKNDRARAGEGTYDDMTPMALCTKAIDTAQQMEAYPKNLKIRHYEIENFPYARYQKSVRFLTSEFTIAAAQGFNGVLVSMLPMDADPQSDYADSEAWFDALVENRALWDRLCEFTEKLHGEGFWPAISRRYDARRPLKQGDSFFKYTDERTENNVRRICQLMPSGFPLTADRTHACGVVLIGDMVNGFDDEELREFLSKGVLMDGAALAALEERGLGRYAGVSCGEVYTDGVKEFYNREETLAAGLCEKYRDIRMTFWGGKAYCLKPIDGGVRVISYLRDYDDHELGVAATAYENELGGRVCVLGYGAFDRVYTTSGHCVLRRLAEYLSRGQLTVARITDGPIAHFVRSDGEKTSIALTNLSLDDARDVRIRFSKASKVCQLGADGRETSLPLDGGNIVLPEIRPYETMVILAE